MIKEQEIFGFCITIFSEQAQNKTKSGSKRLFY